MQIDYPIRIALADDHHVTRAGIRAILEATTDVEIVGEAKDGNEALALAREQKPDLLFLDIEMPGITGVEVARILKAEQSNTKIIALSAFDYRDYVYGILQSGASGYLRKDEANPETLTQAITTVLGSEEDLWVSDRLAGQLVRAQAREIAYEEARASLSEREIEVLGLVSIGLNNEAIAERLFIANYTVKNHTARVREKLGLRTRAELIAWAWQNGFVRRGQEPQVQ